MVFVDLRPELLDAAFDGLLGAAAVDDRGVVFVDRGLLAPAEVFGDFTLSSLMPVSSIDRLAAGQDGNVFHHGLAAIAEAEGAFTAA